MKLLPWVKEKILRFLIGFMSLSGSFGLAKKLDKDRICKILLIQFGGLGDMVLVTPSIKSIINAFPNAEISILGYSEYHSSFLLNFPNVVEIMGLDIYSADMRQIFKTNFWREIFKKIAFIRKRRYDLLITFRYLKLVDWLFIMSMLVFFSMARFKVGLNPDFLRHKSIYHKWVSQNELPGHHYIDLFLRLLEAAEIPANEKATGFPISNSAQIAADRLLADLPEGVGTVCIHTGGTRLSLEKELWSFDHYTNIVRGLNSRGFYVLLVGAQEDSPHADKICKDNIYCLKLTGKTNIEELAAVIKRADLFIGNDSGPFHVAVAMGTPAIGVFTRREDEPEYYQYKSSNVFVFKNNYTEKPTIEGVLQKADEFISKLKVKAHETDNMQPCQ